MSSIPSQKLALAEGSKLNSHNVKNSDPERRIHRNMQMERAKEFLSN